MGFTRREMLLVGGAGFAALANSAFSPGHAAEQNGADDTAAFVAKHMGRAATSSDRVHLIMPAKFPTGYTVPMELKVDSPMTVDDHVKRISVFAPKNPLIDVAKFNFVPERSMARVSKRIRLAEPQFVVAIAEMSDGSLLMAKTYVDVATNGCI
jgi:sulfur-oxidizing protein SoxY